ncbi:MAG: hypothetical protein KC588_06625 [Nitrospira sp.]|nr:hypothetical protein [Nitrospira sp.]
MRTVQPRDPCLSRTRSRILMLSTVVIVSLAGLLLARNAEEEKSNPCTNPLILNSPLGANWFANTCHREWHNPVHVRRGTRQEQP